MPRSASIHLCSNGITKGGKVYTNCLQTKCIADEYILCVLFTREMGNFQINAQIYVSFMAGKIEKYRSLLLTKNLNIIPIFLT